MYSTAPPPTDTIDPTATATATAIHDATPPFGPDLPLSGRALRFVLVDLLVAHRRATVAELAATVEGAGYVLPGRASKIISDALRWEVRRGRVVRLGRGRYAIGEAPPRTTARRIHLFAARSRAWITAARTGRRPPPTPISQRRSIWPFHHAGNPPWAHLGWLWTT